MQTDGTGSCSGWGRWGDLGTAGEEGVLTVPVLAREIRFGKDPDSGDIKKPGSCVWLVEGSEENLLSHLVWVT